MKSNIWEVKDKKVFTKSKTLSVVFVLCVFLSGLAIANEVKTYKIGVLAKRGPERCLAKWTATANYLTDKVDGASFEIVPLDFEKIHSAVGSGQVDFVIANSSFYVSLELLYGTSRIATLKNLVGDGKFATVFGGVIFCRADRADIHEIADLKEKTFMAVKETSFGGWQTAWRELKDCDIDPYKDFADLQFGGTHDAVVYAVVEGRVDAGTVRTDTLERMVAEGKIELNDFRIIFAHSEHKYCNYNIEVIPNSKLPVVEFPLLHSTRLYPECPFAKTPETDDEVAEKVSAALLSMSAECDAAKTANCAGWTIPYNYLPVYDCLKELRVGPYKDYGKVRTAELIKQYWSLLLGAAGVILTIAVFAIRTRMLNIKLRKSIVYRKQSESQLQESKDRFDQLAEHSGTFTWEVDTSGLYTYVSHMVKQLLGYRPEEMVGRMHFYDLHPEVGREAFKDAVFEVFKRKERLANVENAIDRKSTRRNSSHTDIARMPSSA